MPLPLEDNAEDVLAKAQRGLVLPREELSNRCGLPVERVRAVVGGGPAEDHELRALALALDLNPNALIALARKAWAPEVPTLPDGFAQFTTRYEEMTVNAYVVWDSQSRRAAVIDTGADAADILALIQQQKLQVEFVLLTHAHGDHVADLSRLVRDTGARAWISEREPFGTATPFPDGASFSLGPVKLETRPTWGHSPGGTTFVVSGLPLPLAAVGDSIFAGSMGGGVFSYPDALRNNIEQIFTLPDDTLLACGHGPLTTVGQEKRHNPFFASHFS